MRRPPVTAGEEAPEEELAGLRVHAVELATADAERGHAGPLLDDVDDPHPVPERRDERGEHAPGEGGERDKGEDPPVPRRAGVQREVAAGRDLVEPGERDARVRRQVHRVPELVGESPPHDHERAPADREEQERTDRRGDHAGERSAPHHCPELVAERAVRRHRVALDLQHDVDDHEVDAEVAVPAVPLRQAVEAGEPLEHRQPREQHDLHEREIRADETGEPGRPREQVGRRVHGEIAVVDPDPDEGADVAEVDRPRNEQGDGMCRRIPAHRGGSNGARS